MPCSSTFPLGSSTGDIILGWGILFGACVTLLAILHFDSSVCIPLYIRMNLPRAYSSCWVRAVSWVGERMSPFPIGISFWQLQGKQPEHLNLLESSWTVEWLCTLTVRQHLQETFISWAKSWSVCSAHGNQLQCLLENLSLVLFYFLMK